MRRFSIAMMMALIVYVSLAFAAFSRPTPLWAEAWWTATAVVLTVALLGAVYARRPRRSFWGGFAISGWVFLALHLFPSIAPRMVTHGLSEKFYRTLSYRPQSPDEPVWVRFDGRFYEGQASPDTRRGNHSVTFRTPERMFSGDFRAGNLRPISLDGYQQLLASILAPLLGLAGGVVARIFAGRENDPPR